MDKSIFRWVKIDFDGPALESVTQELHKAIRGARERIESIADDDEWIDAKTESEIALIEGLIGASFVVYQTYLTAVWSTADSLRKNGANGVPENKAALWGTESSLVAETGYKLIQTVNGVANYFKHHEEWPDDWTTATKMEAKKTIEIVTAAGLRREAIRTNLQDVVQLMGDDDCSGACKLVHELRAWRKRVVDRIESANL